jgi:hypothetical protein
MNTKGNFSPFYVSMAFLGAIGFAGLFLLSPRPSTASADQTPNLAGTWKLNKDKSDNPRQKMQEAMASAGGGQSGGGYGQGGGYRQRGGGGQAGPRGNMMDEFTQLTIVQNGSDIKITGVSGRTLAVLPADTNANSNSGSNSNSDTNSADQPAPPPPTVHWQDNQLIAEMEGRRGGKTTRTYELSPDGKELYVTTRMENPRFSQPVTFRFVYDPAKSN